MCLVFPLRAKIILLLTEFLLGSVVEHQCRSGHVYVQCDWNTCNQTWPTKAGATRAIIEKIDVVVFNGARQIGNSNITREQYSANFTVPFDEKHPLIQNQTNNLTCVWRSVVGKTELCRRNVWVDLGLVPRYPSNLNLSFEVYSYKHINNFTSKRINVRYYIENTDTQQGTNVNNYFAHVDMYNLNVRDCQGVKTDRKQASDKSICKVRGADVSCPGLLRDRILWRPRVYAVNAVANNSFGMCMSKELCRRVGYYEIFGSIKDVKLLNLHPVGLRVSWRYPDELMNNALDVTFGIKICSNSEECQVVIATRASNSDKMTFKIIKNKIDYNKNYSVRMRYAVSELPTDVSPWTKSVRIATFSKIPDSYPWIRTCQRQTQGLLVSWLRLNDSVITYYKLKIEEPEKINVFKRLSVDKCDLDVCSLVYNVGYNEKSLYQVGVCSCSSQGCSLYRSSYCPLPPGSVQQKSKEAASGADNGIHISWIAFIVVCIAIGIGAVTAYVVYKARRRQRTKRTVADVIVIHPRPPAIDIPSSSIGEDHVYDTVHS